MTDLDLPLAVRNLQNVSASTCHFVSDSPHLRLGAVRTIIDDLTRTSQRVEVIGIAESRLADKCRAYVMARKIESAT